MPRVIISLEKVVTSCLSNYTPNIMKILKSIFASIFFLGSSFTLLSANFVGNGSFESGTSTWNNVAYDGGSANYSIKTTDAPEGNNYLEAEVTALGNNTWSIQSVHQGLSPSLTIANQYTLTFYAKANSSESLLHIILQEGGVWQPVFKRALTNKWQKYTVNFTAEAANPALKFQYEKTGVYSIDGVNIDDWTGINEAITVNLDPDNKHQIMQGFGGALTWFIYRLDDLPERNMLIDKFVNDVGIDILRVKNWYYPANYPSDKSTTNMEAWNENVSFRPTIDFVNDFRALNPDLKVLLSSWGPPKSLKSNNNASGGTLSESSGQFNYGQLANYYVDVLDHIGFNPDWISFQNEPGYTDTWRTCEWRPTETVDFPGLDQALDSIYDAVKDRPNLPKILAPEVENIGNVDWSPLGTTYRAFTEPLKDKPYIDFYAFHNYNYNNVSSINDPFYFNVVRDEYNEHPSIMTEYSGTNHSWLDAATLIQNTVVEAGASGYIWWSLVWGPDSKAMVKIDDIGNWEYSKEYHLIKHFAKYVDNGFKRVELTGNNDTYKGTAYINPTDDKVTLVLVNNNTEQEVQFSLNEEWGILSETSYQSTPSINFNPVSTDIENGIILPDSSITTIVLSVEKTPTVLNEVSNDDFQVFPNPTKGIVKFSKEAEFEIISVLGKLVSTGKGTEADLSQLELGMYFIRTNGITYPINKIK